MRNRALDLVQGIGSLAMAIILLVGAIALDALVPMVFVGVAALLGFAAWELGHAFGGKKQQGAEVEDLSERISGLGPDDSKKS